MSDARASFTRMDAPIGGIQSEMKTTPPNGMKDGEADAKVPPSKSNAAHSGGVRASSPSLADASHKAKFAFSGAASEVQLRMEY